MREDSQGFLYPCFARDEKCKVCGVCDKTCPTMPILPENPVYAYAAWAKDNAIVVSSSSGGLFQLLARYVISKEGVVFGAAFDEDFKVIHKSAQTLEQISDLLGSKYVQSDIGNTYREAKEFLSQGRLVLYSGVPCQLAGLHSFLGDKLANTDNLIRVDVFCMGSPSPGIWREYVDVIKKKYKRLGTLNQITFRDYEGNDWRGKPFKFKLRNIPALRKKAAINFQVLDSLIGF
jgi:coenzyme F420-reducing hydrogenase beta subunit